MQSGDADALARVPGLGVKSAQKVILALRGKLLPPDDLSAGVETELIRALTGMGFSQRQAARAVAAALQESERSGSRPDEAQLLRAAIQILGAGR